MPTLTIRSVYPSGFAWATAFAPRIPAAPLRFSTTTGLGHFALSFVATVRAEISVPPPGGKGTTNVIGLEGYGCENAFVAMTSANTKNKVRNFITSLREFGICHVLRFRIKQIPKCWDHEAIGFVCENIAQEINFGIFYAIQQLS